MLDDRVRMNFFVSIKDLMSNLGPNLSLKELFTKATIPFISIYYIGKLGIDWIEL